MLSKKQVSDICLLNGDYKQCRYLDNDWEGCQCLKLRPDEKKKIDVKMSEFLEQCKKKGLDPMKQNAPLGDNCSGLPFLKHIEVGLK